MAGRSTYSDADKAAVLAAYHANGGNLARTSRDTGIHKNTIRHWLEKAPPSEEAVEAALDDFVEDAQTLRNRALGKLQELVDNDQVSARELITVIGVLDDKVTRAKGLPTQRTEHQHTLPTREELSELLGGFVKGAISAAEQRDDEIIDAEYRVVEPQALPSPREQAE